MVIGGEFELAEELYFALAIAADYSSGVVAEGEVDAEVAGLAVR